uniref:Secreted protein n=1 Tax=Oryza meridionalis TaxID=40149 RepID=A0A0E0EYJ3_9ORYZ
MPTLRCKAVVVVVFMVLLLLVSCLTCTEGRMHYHRRHRRAPHCEHHHRAMMSGDNHVATCRVASRLRWRGIISRADGFAFGRRGHTAPMVSVREALSSDSSSIESARDVAGGRDEVTRSGQATISNPG